MCVPRFYAIFQVFIYAMSATVHFRGRRLGCPISGRRRTLAPELANTRVEGSCRTPTRAHAHDSMADVSVTQQL